MTPLEAAWQAVLDAPDDDAALLVLADALLERGDPHGELIRLALAGDEATHHLVGNATALLGDPRRLKTCGPRFERGFLLSLRVTTVADLEALLSRPIGRLLRAVEVASATEEPVEPFSEALVRGAPATLSSVTFGNRGLSPQPAGELNVAALLSGVRSIQELTVATWAANFEGAASAGLRRLTLSLVNPVRGLGEASFRSLESLSLELPFRRIELPLSLLSGEVAPSLRTLTLEGALWPAQLHELSVSSLLRDLTELRITAEAETGWYPALLETIDSFAHLQRIELLADRHHPDWVVAVKAALPQAIVTHPQLRL
jgi:uncharacterized protein (TIGR02996 family)